MIPQRARLWMNLEDWSNVTIHQLSVSGGRGSPTGTVDSTTITITILLPKAYELPTIGDRIDVSGWVTTSDAIPDEVHRSLFTGRVTDVALEMGAGPGGVDVLSLVAVDWFRELDGVNITATWTQNNWAGVVDQVWRLAAAEMGDPAWMLVNDITSPNDFRTAGLISQPDGQAQPALGTLSRLWDQLAHVVYFRPNQFQSGNPNPPAGWQSNAFATSLFQDASVDASPRVVVPASLIRADAIPRYSANLGGVGNDITLSAIETVSGENVEVVLRETGGDPAQHGRISKRIDTNLLHNPQDANAPALLHAYLIRLQYPGLDLDGVRLSWRDGHIDDAMADAWGDLLDEGGPVGTGTLVTFEGLSAGRPDPERPGWNMWVVEGMTITLLVDGWDIDLSLSHPGYYSGGIPPTPDPRHSYAEIPVTYATYDAMLAAVPTYADLLGV